MIGKKQYYAYSDQSIVIPKKWYKKIRKYIKTATVHDDYGYMTISLNCHERYHGLVEIIVDFQSVDGETMCDNCVLRLEKLLGNCSHHFKPLRSENNLNYLIDILHKKNFKNSRSIRDDIRFRWETGYESISGGPWLLTMFFLIGLIFLGFFIGVKQIMTSIFKR